MDGERGYRVELGVGGAIERLGFLAAGMVGHRTALDPFWSRVRLDGRTEGDLVLIDEATGGDVARRRLAADHKRSDS